jgi:pyruvate dehydrogenase E2 component (dihydrolipoamide acetyltransferase)
MASDLRQTEDGKIIAKTVPFIGVRRQIAENLSESLSVCVPNFSFVRADVSKLTALRGKYKEKGLKIGYTDMMIKLCAPALAESPFLNASINGKKIELYESVNIAVGVSTEDDLLYAPVIRNVEKKSVLEVAAELKALAEKVRAKTITLEDMSGGTFTFSSTGAYEIDGSDAIIPQPQAAIMTVGNFKDEAVVDELKNIVVRPVVYLGFTVDHRVVQGIALCKFIEAYLKCLNDPESYLVLCNI